MDCSEYLDKFLSPHADGELTARERRKAEDHLEGCGPCRARMAEERSFKVLVREHAGMVRVPAEVRLKIRAAIGEMAEPFAGRSQSKQRRPILPSRRMGTWIPLAAAATLLLCIGIYARHSMGLSPAAELHPVPAFDLAIAKYDSFVRDFVPNVPADRDGSDLAWVVDRDNAEPEIAMRDDVGRSYAEADMPNDLYDFDNTGFQLGGGRLDHLADGRPVTYTIYRRADDTILNVDLKDPSMSAPVGAVYWLGMHSFYNYKGYSFCLTFHQPGHFVSITLMRAPVAELIRNVALADAVATEGEQ
jgi:hypothetical protein